MNLDSLEFSKYIYLIFADTEQVTALPATVLTGDTAIIGETTVHTGTERGIGTGSGIAAPRGTGSAVEVENESPSTGSIMKTETGTETGREKGTG